MNEIALSTTACTVEYDDLIYKLQRFGGISEYWDQVTTRVARMPDMHIVRHATPRWKRYGRRLTSRRVHHSSYFRTALGPGVRNVTTVHDMAYELGHSSGWRTRLGRIERRRAYFSSDAIICISAHTRDTLLQVFPELSTRSKLVVIPHGVTTLQPEEALLSQNRQPGDFENYVLFVGGRKGYKNFEGALHALHQSGLTRQGMSLVCTGQPIDHAETELIERLGLRAHVRSVGYVSQPELARLYGKAYALIYPSRFEGFGLPLLEAMQMRCPVVASDASCLPEIAGDAALLAPPSDAPAMGHALASLQDTDLRARIVAKGDLRVAQFSWDLSAAAHAALYQSL